jgi:hypothetical protein
VKKRGRREQREEGSGYIDTLRLMVDEMEKLPAEWDSELAMIYEMKRPPKIIRQV